VADYDIWHGRKFSCECRGQYGVELDQREVPRGAGEQSGNGTASGTDLDHGVRRNVAERGDDAKAGICIY
jgi:hypothetical protein